MNPPTLTADELLAWLEKTTASWHKLLTSHPEFFTAPCDIAGVQTVAQLLQHIFAVELRYAERLADLPVSDYANIAFDTVDSLYATHGRAVAILRQLLDSDIDWNQSIEFTTRSSGPVRSTRKTILFHTLFHGIRHYAQLATLARQHGFKTEWPMDYLFMGIERV
jgi:uncharacterized damage-inducible protein DinB